MDYVVERMRHAPCAELRVVTRPAKRDVIENAARHGAKVIEADPASLGESLICGIEGLDDDDVVLVGFPDSIWEPVDGYSRVLRLLDDGWAVGLGLFEAQEMRRYEPVVADDSGRVRRIEFKPDRPSSSWLWGCAAVRAGTLRALRGRDEPGPFFDSLAAEGRVGAVRLPGRYLDMGTPAGLDQARNGSLRTTALLLGSGGWIPTSRRETCSALIRRGDRAVIVDAGTGVSRLVEDPGLLGGVSSVEIVLTHFHLDHVAGLVYLPALELPAPPRIHAPGRWLYGEPSERILETLVSPPFFALRLGEVVSEVRELDPGGAEIGGFGVSVRAQRRHDAPTAALRFGDLLTYCTDTAYDKANADLARGSAALVHEAWGTDSDFSPHETHSSAREAALVARDADVESLVLIHVRPGQDERALVDEARAAFPAATLGSDLLSVPTERA
jgi:phosphoribosyl 1,2-cyclic phosphodiesterase